MARQKVLLRSEQTSGRASLTESTLPAGAKGPPLHKHDFDEGFYVLDGELTLQVGDTRSVARTGEFGFAPGGVAHTLANRSTAPVRFLILCSPAGFERELARRAARADGADPPDWALKEVPTVTRLGPPMED
jgi:quercetin dioxygenase-like cupin family protein